MRFVLAAWKTPASSDADVSIASKAPLPSTPTEQPCGCMQRTVGVRRSRPSRSAPSPKWSPAELTDDLRLAAELEVCSTKHSPSRSR